MQVKYSNINDIFLGTGDYPLKNLNKNNRWVKMADTLDWNYIEEEYNKRFNNQEVRGEKKPARMVIGALLIKHIESNSDQETIFSIQENPYQQYLVGLEYFQTEPIFSPELFATLHQCIDVDSFSSIMHSTHHKWSKKKGI